MKTKLTHRSALLFSLMLSGFLFAGCKSKEEKQTACIENLQKMEDAKDQWALENKKNSGDMPSEDIIFGPTKYIKERPVCPTGGIYTLNPVATNATCSIPGHSLP